MNHTLNPTFESGPSALSSSFESVPTAFSRARDSLNYFFQRVIEGVTDRVIEAPSRLQAIGALGAVAVSALALAAGTASAAPEKCAPVKAEAAQGDAPDTVRCSIGTIKLIQSICTAYTMYFNRKYKRLGGLFQGITNQ